MWLSGLHIPESYLTAVMQVRMNGGDYEYPTKTHGFYTCVHLTIPNISRQYAVLRSGHWIN